MPNGSAFSVSPDADAGAVPDAADEPDALPDGSVLAAFLPESLQPVAASAQARMPQTSAMRWFFFNLGSPLRAHE
ncbi:hypothetical protein [Cohnella rhizosphaerae]|uniref:Uncharacterized protein n=1 Tax=Cohnella rhizosphaerae TaxID=1457232 RepID=A0A9X4KS82_9BACL|nr:hypothetical protein [Cohnella rhizosphaerae]MDG0809900.1 hypothetical protein [Cohnella rhizosphaerae]